MAREEVTKNRTKEPVRSVTCTYDFPDDINGMIESWGGDVVYSNAKANARVSAQSVINGGIVKGLTDEQIQERLDRWKPGVALEAAQEDPVQQYKKMSAEEREEFIRKIQEITE